MLVLYKYVFALLYLNKYELTAHSKYESAYVLRRVMVHRAVFCVAE